MRSRLRAADALLPAALVLWVVAVRAIDSDAMNDWGLFPALPVVFFVALGLLIASIVVVLADDESSSVRLGAHLVAFIVVLHGTVPAIMSVPNYPWVYKHIGVVEYINAHGSLDTRIDIYHNWPGFFALSAWFTKVAGASSPVSFAGWAPVYFNMLTCLELGFVFRCLPVGRRVRWIALFLFVAGNWVGQDYFSPQAITVVLSLAAFGIVLRWLQVDRPVAVVKATRWMLSRLVAPSDGTERAEGVSASSARSRVAVLGTLFAVFAAIVVSHQLSPYMVIAGVGMLTAAGLVRPRYVVAGLVVVAAGYLFLRLTYLQRTQNLLGSVFDPFRNLNSDGYGDTTGEPGRMLALSAPALILAMWSLAGVGVLRRLRSGRPTLVIVLLAVSPVLIAFGQSYGGEAIFRIYLFTLPWIALLGGSALHPSARRRTFTVKAAAVLSGLTLLFMCAFFGSEGLYRVRSGELEAGRHFYDNAEPGSLLVFAAPRFPGRMAANYDRFPSSDSSPNLLTTTAAFRRRLLGDGDVSRVSRFVEDQGGRPGRAYLVLSTDQQIYAQTLGLLPRGSLPSLDRALTGSSDWRVSCRNQDAVVYRYRPRGGGPPVRDCRGSSTLATETVGWSNSVAIWIAFLGAGFLVVTRKRKQTMFSRPHASDLVPVSNGSIVQVVHHTALSRRKRWTSRARPSPSAEELVRQILLWAAVVFAIVWRFGLVRRRGALR